MKTAYNKHNNIQTNVTMTHITKISTTSILVVNKSEKMEHNDDEEEHQHKHHEREDEKDNIPNTNMKWTGPAGSHTHWIDATGQTHEFIGRSKKVEEL